jgi:hypothetical protein
MAGFGITDIETLGTVTTELVMLDLGGTDF